MSDLVRRADIIKHLDDVRNTPPELQYVWSVVTAIKCFVEEMPTIDAAPVKRGRWETNNDPEEVVKDFSCSVCEELLCDFDTYALMPGENCFYYCPNCGAKMDLEVE